MDVAAPAILDVDAAGERRTSGPGLCHEAVEAGSNIRPRAWKPIQGATAIKITCSFPRGGACAQLTKGSSPSIGAVNGRGSDRLSRDRLSSMARGGGRQPTAKIESREAGPILIETNHRPKIDVGAIPRTRSAVMGLQHARNIGPDDVEPRRSQPKFKTRCDQSTAKPVPEHLTDFNGRAKVSPSTDWRMLRMGLILRLI